MRKTAVALALSVALLLAFESTMPAVAQSSSNTSAPAIEWQKDYGYGNDNDYFGVESASNLIQTNDGGYIFMDEGWSHQTTFIPSTIYKVDSSGTIEWNKTIRHLAASTIIQTNDKGYEILGQWSTYGTTYEHTPTLIKLDSKGNIQWTANYSRVPDLGVTSTQIQTSDSGFVYWKRGTITKTDTNNDTQWTKNVTYPTLDAFPTYTEPLSLFSVIETSDGALAALGVGYDLLDNPRTGKIYLIKTEAFLPLPAKTTLPAPIQPSSMTPMVEVTITIIVIIVAAAAAGLLFYFKKRKR
jgi:hypothetical protein